MSPAQIFYANLFTFKIFISCSEATDAIFFLKKKQFLYQSLCVIKKFQIIFFSQIETFFQGKTLIKKF